jgi:hypothetical protein
VRTSYVRPVTTPGYGLRVRSRDYGPDALAPKPRLPVPTVDAELDLVLEDAQSGFCGAVVVIERAAITLEDRHGRRRVFPYTDTGLLLEGKPVRVQRPRPATPVGVRRTASGSVAAPDRRARVARASRIFVEGKHDCELVEAVWGDDLRDVGVVVEELAGADNLLEIVRSFDPGAEARLGVLLDHLVPGSKESRIAEQVSSPHVLVVGHPFVDIWQAVKPGRLGLDAWPTVPRGLSWKDGITAALGEPDAVTAWRRIRGSVRSYLDLEPEILGPVEALIDFVTAEGAGE